MKNINLNINDHVVAIIWALVMTGANWILIDSNNFPIWILIIAAIIASAIFYLVGRVMLLIFRTLDGWVSKTK